MRGLMIENALFVVGGKELSEDVAVAEAVDEEVAATDGLQEGEVGLRPWPQTAYGAVADRGCSGDGEDDLGDGLRVSAAVVFRGNPAV